MLKVFEDLCHNTVILHVDVRILNNAHFNINKFNITLLQIHIVSQFHTKSFSVQSKSAGLVCSLIFRATEIQTIGCWCL